MSNINVLAVQARGNPALMLPLWDAVRGLVVWWANKRARYATRLFDVDDLIQAGYLALTDAVASYVLEKGDFTAWLSFYVRSYFAEAACRRGRKHRPEIDAVSLDTPFGEGGDILGDMVADPAAEFADSVVELEAARQDYALIMTEIDRLPDYLRLAIMLTCWKGLGLRAAAKAMGVSRNTVASYVGTAKRKIRESEAARQIWRDRYLPRRVGLHEFKATRTSEVEKHLLWLEEAGLL